MGSHILKANWSSASARWSLETEDGRSFACKFLFCCGGYYSYDEPYQPIFPGRDRFPGRVIHPQLWSAEDDTCYQGKRVAVIGSGATAVTLMPNLVKGGAAHVVMVQRTPTYMAAFPEVDRIAVSVAKVLPAATAHTLARWKSIMVNSLSYRFIRAYPATSKKLLLNRAKQELKGSLTSAEFKKHFTPPYKPWDQRICLCPDGDFFDGIKSKNVSVVTDHIESFTEKGIQMKSGEHVDADIIITATGLTLQKNFPMSTMQVTIDGEPYKPAEEMVYKGMMISGVPNFAFTVGYTNASWTLKADLTSAYVARLLNHMRAKKIAICCPTRDTSDLPEEGALALESGYVLRSKDSMPKQGTKAPWLLHNDYVKDKFVLQYGSLNDSKMRFSPPMSRL